MDENKEIQPDEVELQRMGSAFSAVTSVSDADLNESRSDDYDDDDDEKKMPPTELAKVKSDTADETGEEVPSTPIVAKVIIGEDVTLSRKYEKYLTIENHEIVDRQDKIDALILQLKLPHIYTLHDDEQYGIIQNKYSWIDDEDGEIDQFQYEEIQEVVHHMTSIERRHMYDTMASKLYEDKEGEGDEKEREKYRFMPAKLKTLNRYVKMRDEGVACVCSGCGVLLFESKSTKKKLSKKKFNKKYGKTWRGYICRETGREVIFHNRLCVKFRKAKEWIRDAVYARDLALGYTDQPTRMQIDFLKSNEGLSASLQPSQFYTTFDESEKKRVNYKHNIRWYYAECVSTDLRGYDIDEGDRFSLIPVEIKYLDQREFAIAMFEWLMLEVQIKEFTLFWMFLKFSASYINTPKLISLLKEHSPVLFPLHDGTDPDKKNELIEFLTIICEGALYPIATCLYIAAYLKDNGDLYWNESETEILSKHFRNMANTIIDEIESEHLVAIILETPTNVYDDDEGEEADGLSVIDIAIKYKMLRFLQNVKISRIATTLWYDRRIIHPSVHFGDELSFFDLFARLAQTPATFYFSPSGLNIIRFMLYALYLMLFSWVTFARRYTYDQEGIGRGSHTYLWIYNIASILYEFYRMLSRIKTYFASFRNITEFTKVVIWIVLFFIRFIYSSDVANIDCVYVIRSADPFYIDCGISLRQNNRTRSIECEKLVYREDPYDCSQYARHNELITEVYMALWAVQCVLFWLTLLFYLERTRTVGPMLRMISLMVRDMFNFLFLMIVLWFSISFAIYYIIGDDLQADDEVLAHKQLNSDISSTLFYGVLIMFGQQEWDALPHNHDAVSPFRSDLLAGVVAFGAFAGTVLLLNLLIAMLSNTYNEVSELSVLEVNYTRISASYAASRDITLIPPPLNYLAFALMSLWFLCDTLLTACSARTKMLNDWFFTPLNRRVFSAGDFITYKDVEDGDRIKQGYVKFCYTSEIAEIQVGSVTKFIHQDNILRIHKNIVTDIPQTTTGLCITGGRFYCKYCRYFFHGNQVGNVEQITNLFKYYGIRLDDDDTGKLSNMLNETNARTNVRSKRSRRRKQKKQVDLKEATRTLSLRQLGVAQLCPQCYRAFYCSSDHCDEVQRAQYLSEICSFAVFMLCMYLPLCVLFAIPAAISYVVQILIGKQQLFGGAKAKRQKQEKKLAKKIKMSQINDKYRRLVVRNFDDIRPTNEYVESITIRLNKLHKKIRESQIDDEEDNIVTQMHQEMQLAHLTLTPKECTIRMKRLKQLYREWCDKLDRILNIIVEKKRRVKAEQEKRKGELMRLMAEDEEEFNRM
eukprot:542904_1